MRETPLHGHDGRRYFVPNAKAMTDVIDVGTDRAAVRQVHAAARPDMRPAPHPRSDQRSAHVVVDWPEASVGAAWMDLVGLLPALELDGGPTPEDLFERHAVGRAADPDAVTAFVASIAGYFTRMSLMAPPPGLPTVRLFQAAQGRIARRWIAHRQGWNTADVSP